MAEKMIGKYQIRREMGRGSMGIVCEALDTQSGLRVSLKLLAVSQLVSSIDRRQLVERFKREARAAGSLVHPNIAQVYECGEFANNYYMAMEFCEGVTLRQVLQFEKKLPEQKLTAIADQLLGALELAHSAGIIHRDIKPDNIMVDGNNRIKLMDFGVAKDVSSGSLTQTGQMMGSPAYMSPEQVMGKNISPRSDLFSTGVLLYECMTGKKPFEADTITAITHKIVYENPPPIYLGPDYLSLIIAKALEKEPANRYFSAAEMRDDILKKHAPIQRYPTQSRGQQTVTGVPSQQGQQQPSQSMNATTFAPPPQQPYGAPPPQPFQQPPHPAPPPQPYGAPQPQHYQQPPQPHGGPPQYHQGHYPDSQYQSAQQGQQTVPDWVVVLLLFLFPLIGLILMWGWTEWSQNTKIAITLLFALPILIGIICWSAIFADIFSSL